MDLNTIALTVLGCGVLYGAYIVWKASRPPVPKNLKTPWGEQVGRTRPIQSKSGDASMATELNRRRAIQGSGRLNHSKIKESRTSTGSSTGAMETFFLSSICPPAVAKVILPPILKVCEFLFDGGDAFTDYYTVLDGFNGLSYDTIYDAGYPYTQVCDAQADVMCESDFIMDGGPNVGDSAMTFDASAYGIEYDAGGVGMEVCADIYCSEVLDGGADAMTSCEEIDADGTNLLYDAGGAANETCPTV